MDFKAPDNYINLSSVRHQSIDFYKESDLLGVALDAAEKENDIQRYIKDNGKWFIPASLLLDYDFGHHAAYLVPEQSLGAEYRADYMLLGFNSIGPQLILVEFEDVNVPYKISTSNSENASVRKGLTQIKDWKRWMDDNRSYFLQSTGLTGAGLTIPSWGINYCLVVSRRKFMNDTANAMRGQSQRESPDLHIVSYDRLIDNVRKLVNGF